MPTDSNRRICVALLRVGLVYSAVIVSALLIAWELPWSVAALASQQQKALLVALFAHLGIGIGVLLCLMRVHRDAKIPARMPRVILATSVCLFFVCCDLLAAIAFPPFEFLKLNYLMHPARGWTNPADHLSESAGAAVLYNSRGMRIDPERPTTTQPDGPPILFLGDSLTFGWGVQYGECFSAQTVELLNARHPNVHFHTLNGGTSGYDTAQEADWLEEVGMGLRPKVVVLQFCLNDAYLPFSPEKVWENRFAGDQFCPGPPLSWSGIGRGIYIWNNLPRTNTGLSAQGAKVEWFGISELLKPQESPRVVRAWDRVVFWLDRIESRCRTAGIPMLLICFPVVDQLSDPTVSRNSQVRLAEWSARRGVVFVNMLPEYLRRTSDGNLARRTYFIDLTHPSVEGHRVAAEALASALEHMPVVQSLSKP